MKREIFLHFSFWFSFFVLITLTHKFFDLSFWPFWVGGIVGTILPDFDHILYIYLRPQEFNSQRVGYMVGKRQIKETFSFLYATRSERNDLIFHTAFFQLIFLVLTFWILTSSGSIFAKGLVIAFSLHLLIDQIIDLVEVKNFNNWLKFSPFYIDLKTGRIYWLVIASLIILFGVFL